MTDAELQKLAISQYQLKQYHSRMKAFVGYKSVSSAATTFTVEAPTQNTVYTFSNALTQIDLTSIPITSTFEVIIFFSTASDSGTTTINTSTSQRVVGDIDLENGKSYVLAVFKGAIVCQETTDITINTQDITTSAS